MLLILNYSMIKKSFNSILLISAFVLLKTVSYSQNVLNAKFKLLPVPKKIESLQGTPLSHNSLTGFRLEGTTTKPVLDEPLNNLKETTASGKGSLVLKIDSNNASASAEGYTLEIKNGYVTITSKTQAGLFYGAQTLSQLLEDAKDQQLTIPACHITDFPDIDYRAIHLDL